MTPRYCEDCRFYFNHDRHGAGTEFAMCGAPQNRRAPPLVARQDKSIAAADGLRWPYARQNRDMVAGIDILFRMCGRRGRWFQPKEPSR